MQIKSLDQHKCMIVNLEKGLRTQRSYKLFLSTINSPRTLMKYDGDLLKFMKFSKYLDYDSILLDDSETIQEHLEDYVMEVKKTTVKRSTVKGDRNVTTSKLSRQIILGKLSPIGFQLLCANCNFAKADLKACPIDHSLD